jgi:hypothetical protein
MGVPNFGNACPPGISTESTADGAHAPEMRQTRQPRGSIRGSCGARRSKHAVHWPDTPKFSDLRGLLQRGRTAGPKAPSSPRWNPSNFKWVTLGGDPARFADQSAILEGGCAVAVPSGHVPKPAARYFQPWRVYAQGLAQAARW